CMTRKTLNCSARLRESEGTSEVTRRFSEPCSRDMIQAYLRGNALTGDNWATVATGKLGVKHLRQREAMRPLIIDTIQLHGLSSLRAEPVSEISKTVEMLSHGIWRPKVCLLMHARHDVTASSQSQTGMNSRHLSPGYFAFVMATGIV